MIELIVVYLHHKSSTMKKVILLYLIWLINLPLSIQSQTDTTSDERFQWNRECYKFVDGVRFTIDCDEYDKNAPTPMLESNIDSVCTDMEKRFVETLNKWRREHGIHELEYDKHMEQVLTNPHNQWQFRNGKIGHGEDGISLHEIAKSVGLRGVGECCAYNYRRDMDGVSQFFNQYKESPPHWDILTNDIYYYISVSVLYDKEINRYYSTVNLRW